jgi:predicted TIM-barrel fold metal-dependent hydrolase
MATQQATAPRYTHIDADTHILEPADVWTARVPAKYRDRVPRMVRDDSGRDIWVMEGRQISTVGFFALAGWPTPFPDCPPTLDDCIPAAYDADARLAYMDSIGTWAEVIYPNVAGFGSQKFLSIEDEDLKILCVRAYNDFLRDWASADPRRLLTVMATPYWDIDLTVAEVERGIELGHRGILFTGEPQRFGLPVLADKHWDPLWSLAQEAGLAVHFHIGSGEVNSLFTPERINAAGTAATYGLSSVQMFLGNGMQVADLLLSGVLPRFPELRFVSVESGVGWIPFLLEAVDYSYLEGCPGKKGEWDLMPSEYFRRQVYACTWFESLPFRHMLDADLPLDNICFETDFPHPTCLFGNVAEVIERGAGSLDPASRRKVLWDNAARLYDVETVEEANAAAPAPV